MLPYVWLGAKVSATVGAVLVATPKLGVATALLLYAFAILVMIPRGFSGGMADGMRWLGTRLATLAIAALATGLITDFRWTSPMSDLGVVVILVLIGIWAVREARAIHSATAPAHS